MKNFRELRIWQKGMDIAKQAYELKSSFPPEERFGLSAQIVKCAVSIPSNIAEGCSRSSPKDCLRFLEIALGSGFELETQLLIAGYAGIGNKDLREKMLSAIGEEQRMMSAFIQKLKKPMPNRQ